MAAAPMRLLVVIDGTRQEVMATGDMTARDLRTQVSSGDGVLTLGIGPSAVVLDEDVAISEQGVADRDRLVLTTAASGTALRAALTALSTSAIRIDQLVAQLAAGTPAHPEIYTRVLEELDGIDAFDRCAQCTRRLGDNPPVTRSPTVADYPRPSGTSAGGGGRPWCSERRRGRRRRQERLRVQVKGRTSRRSACGILWPPPKFRLDDLCASLLVRLGLGAGGARRRARPSASAVALCAVLAPAPGAGWLRLLAPEESHLHAERATALQLQQRATRHASGDRRRQREEVSMAGALGLGRQVGARRGGAACQPRAARLAAGIWIIWIWGAVAGCGCGGALRSLGHSLFSLLSALCSQRGRARAESAPRPATHNMHTC